MRRRFGAVDGEIAVSGAATGCPPPPADRRRAGRAARAGARPCGRGPSSRCRARSSRPRGTARRGTRAPPRPDRPSRAGGSQSPAAPPRVRGLDPAGIAVRRRHPRPAVAPLAHRQRLAAERLRHLLDDGSGSAWSGATSTAQKRVSSRRDATRSRSRASRASHSPPTRAIQAAASSSGAGLSGRASRGPACASRRAPRRAARSGASRPPAASPAAPAASWVADASCCDSDSTRWRRVGSPSASKTSLKRGATRAPAGRRRRSSRARRSR